MPTAPASICIFASAGILCVLMWGRLATPSRLRRSCRRWMLAVTVSRSTVTAGVSRVSIEVILAFSALQPVGYDQPRQQQHGPRKDCAQDAHQEDRYHHDMQELLDARH